MYERILVAVDDSATSARAVREAVKLAKRPRSIVRVVHVIEAVTEAEIRTTLGQDPWSGTHLEVDAIEPWTIRLDGRRA